MDNDFDLIEDDKRLRLIASAAIGLSLLTVLLCITTFPVLNNDVNVLEHELQDYVDDLKVILYIILSLSLITMLTYYRYPLSLSFIFCHYPLSLSL